MSFFAKFKKGNDLCPVAASLYGTCATAAGTAEKAVTLPECDVLVPGMSLSVKFTNSNTAANPTLNVNSLGAVPIYRYGITAAGNTVSTSWPAGAVVQFTYGVAVAGNGNTEATYGFYMSGAGGITELTNAIRDLVYPVGSIYMSVNITSPAALFGGTWEMIMDRFLVASGQYYMAGDTGGTANQTLNTNNLPDFTIKANTKFPQSQSMLPAQYAPELTTKKVQLNEASGYYYAGVSDSAISWTGLSYTGGKQPFSILPPYLAVFMWKRVA